MSKITPVILCGGSGTRLWPLSRENHPKQFADLGAGRTLFRDTLARLDLIGDSGSPVCICGEKYLFYVSPLIEEKEGRVILEPLARGTAPALALAAMASKGDLLLALPSDHFFDSGAAFAEAIASAIPLAEAGKIVTLGIKPDSPATGYGYIKAGEKLAQAGYSVSEFVEKPDSETALSFIHSGKYYWNAGIFLFKPDTYLSELKKYEPEIFRQCQLAYAEGLNTEKILRPHADFFEACPSKSIDYAVMERTRHAAVVPFSTAWHDLGSWESFYQKAAKDNSGNAREGKVLLKESTDSYIHSTGRLVAAIGVHNLVVVETPDAILVAPRDKAQNVRSIVDDLKARGAVEYRQHRRVERPWGSYEIIAEGDRFQVKRIIIRPGHALSKELHHHRAEHWIVVSGTAEIANGNKNEIYTENQSTYIPIGVEHKLSNPGIIPLVMIEIQSGAYLGEDDIVRL